MYKHFNMMYNKYSLPSTIW